MRYEGAFVAGQQHGTRPADRPGRLRLRGRLGERRQGRARAGSPIPTARSTRATWPPARPRAGARSTMADGTRYEGGWKAGQIEGEGVLDPAERRPLRGRLRRRPARGARPRHRGERRRLRRRLLGRPAPRRRHADRRRRLRLHRQLGRGPHRGRGQGHLPRRLGLRGQLPRRQARTARGRIAYADGTQLRGRLEGRRDLGRRASRATATASTYEGEFVDGRNHGQGKLDLGGRLQLRGRLGRRAAPRRGRRGLRRRHPLRGRLRARACARARAR